MIKEYLQFLSESKSEDIIEKIKEYLVRDNDYESWEEFVDSQRMGDCQGIVASIIHEFPQVNKVFGGVKIDTPCVDWDDGSENDEITHHWVEIDGTAYDFSKGTLNGYIDMDDYDLYDPEIVDDWRYKDISFYMTKEGWNPFKKKKKNPHVQFDPYGEENWDDDIKMDELRNKFFKIEEIVTLYEPNGKNILQPNSKIYYKHNESYIHVCNQVTYQDGGYWTYTDASFEFGDFNRLERNKFQSLKPLDNDEYEEVLNCLGEVNDFISAKKKRRLTNMEYLKMKFIK